MPKKKITKAEQAEAEKLARSATAEKEKPARKSLPKPKPEAPVSGKLSSREAERSLWAPRVSPPKGKPKKSK
jgi:hypothetical protein